MYLVVNNTSYPVPLKDLKAEVAPRKTLDLELVSSRELIDRSNDLSMALSNKSLRLIRYTVVQDTTAHMKPSAKPTQDTADLKEIIREAVAAEMRAHRAPEQPAINSAHLESVMKRGMADIQESIRNQINNLDLSKENKEAFVDIDPAKLAELQQQTVNRISESIETGGQKETRKISIINKNIKDLASEL